MKCTGTAFVIFLMSGCLAGKIPAGSDLLVTKVYNYELNPNIAWANRPQHLLIKSADDFRSKFYMTKTGIGTAMIPDFTTQSVVAIILEPTIKVVTVEIDKAEIKGKMMNIFYSVTDTTSWVTYKQSPKVIAVIPKSLRINQVTFYKHNIKEVTLLTSE